MCDYAEATNTVLETGCEPAMAKNGMYDDEAGMSSKRQCCKVRRIFAVSV